MRVLVVDADRDVREMIEDLILDQGVEVLEAANFDEALTGIQNDSIDVLLCHARILRAHGGLLKRRVQEMRPQPRVIAMSAAGTRAARDEADANLAKPFTRAKLLSLLRHPTR